MKKEVINLNRQHRINRWIELIVAILLILFSFYLIEVDYQGSKFSVIKSLAEGKAYLLLGPLAGSLLGTICIRWNGSRELALLNRIVIENKNT